MKKCKIIIMAALAVFAVAALAGYLCVQMYIDCTYPDTYK